MTFWSWAYGAGGSGLLAVDPDNPETIEQYTMDLTEESVRTIDRTGGTILHTSRTNPSNVHPGDVPPFMRQEDRSDEGNGMVDCTRHVLRVLDALKWKRSFP